MWGARVVLNFQGKAMRSSQRLTKYQTRALNRSLDFCHRKYPHPSSVFHFAHLWFDVVFCSRLISNQGGIYR